VLTFGAVLIFIPVRKSIPPRTETTNEVG